MSFRLPLSLAWVRRCLLPALLSAWLLLACPPTATANAAANAPATAPAAASTPAAGAGVTAAEAGLGARLFEAHCAGCHIHGGNIIRRGKTLKLAALERQGVASPEAIAAIAAAGVGQMGGYAEVLGEDGVGAVASWVWEQAQAGWPTS